MPTSIRVSTFIDQTDANVKFDGRTQGPGDHWCLALASVAVC